MEPRKACQERPEAGNRCLGETPRSGRSTGNDITGVTIRWGYSDNLGWTGNRDDKPTVFEVKENPSESLDSDLDSGAENWCLLSNHLSDVEAEAIDLLGSFGLENSDQGKAVKIAARWHDWGKSLDRWQKEVPDSRRKSELNWNKLEQMRN